MISRILIFLVGIYRKYISPLKSTPSCRFTPSCSEYAIEALREWGAIIGSALTIWRILRCNPFGRGGYDPVPKRRRKSKTKKDE